MDKKEKHNISIVKDVDGNSIVVINDIRFKGKRSLNWKDLKEYLEECIRWENVSVWYNWHKKRNEQLLQFINTYRTKNPFLKFNYNKWINKCQQKISDDDTEQMQELAFDKTLAGKSDSVYNIISVRCESIGRYRTC